MRKRSSWTASWKQPRESWARLGSEMGMLTLRFLALDARWAVERFKRGLRNRFLLPRVPIPVRAKEVT